MRHVQGPGRASDIRRDVHRIRPVVLMRLSLPCLRKDTTGHGSPSTRSRRLQTTAAGAPAAGGQLRLLGSEPAGAPSSAARFPARPPSRLRGAMAMCNALPRLAHGRSRRCYPGPPCHRLRAAAPTAESGRVVRSSGPRGPRHRRPRLRHRPRRRGAASAASRPPRARARVVETVCLSAQPPTDRSVQRLKQRRRWNAIAHGRAARRRSSSSSARQRARTAAAPCLTSLPRGAPRARACGLPPSLPRPALAP
jgi:hypothetical protein